MKLLLIHSDYLRYEVTGKTAFAEELEDERKKGEFKESLVTFVTVEKVDEENPRRVVERAVEEILHVAGQVHPENIVLYPYVHLLFGGEPASPDIAVEILKGIEEGVGKTLPVYRVPFGFYKAFTLRCKGHPLAEASRVISVEEEAETIEEKAHRIPSQFIILTPEGEEYPFNPEKPEECKVLDRDPLLKSFVYSEEVKGQPSQEPPSVKLMRRLALVDYEPASDPGAFRFYPSGALVKDLLEEWAHQLIVGGLKAMKIDTPLLYDWGQPDIREQGIAFRERSYQVRTPKRTLVLRFAGDFGLFRMMRDAVFSYRQLPIRIYEISPSFRREQRGELVGLRRCSFFHMPDLHSFCKDLDQAAEEYKLIFKKYTELLNGVGIDYAIAFRIVKNYYEGFKPILLELLQHAGRPALIELLEEAKHYWVVKSEHQAIDSVAGNAQLCTVQLDVEDSERYGIYYIDKDGRKKGCIIIHTSVGSIERLMYAILETAAKMEVPTLPVWLSPTQVRIIPISGKYLEYVEGLADEIEKERIRVDVDDRDESVSKRIREAETAWVPYIVVVGEKEVKEGVLTVRVRKPSSKEIITMTKEELVKEIRREVEDKPYKPLYLPRRLSMRPRFAG